MVSAKKELKNQLRTKSIVPASKHTLEMKFEPASYYLGQKIGRIGSILLILLLLGAIYNEYKRI